MLFQTGTSFKRNTGYGRSRKRRYCVSHSNGFIDRIITLTLFKVLKESFSFDCNVI